MNTLTSKKWVGVFVDTNEIPSKFQKIWVVPKDINAFLFYVNRVKNIKSEKDHC